MEQVCNVFREIKNWKRGIGGPEKKNRISFKTRAGCSGSSPTRENFAFFGIVELFCKWIRQNLRIKAFYVTSENAVKTQIWIAICVYVLVAFIKKELLLVKSSYEILSISLFENISILQALNSANEILKDESSCNQLKLFTC